MNNSSEFWRLDRLDHLRAVAALLVVFWHGASDPTKNALFLLSLIQEGHTGVSFFCVISGFILTYIYFDRDEPYLTFISRRMFRILPMLIIYVYIGYYAFSGKAADLLMALTLSIQNGGPLQSINSQTWSVYVELQFYLIFPFLLVFVKQKGIGYLFALWGLMVAMRAGIFLQIGDSAAISYWSILGRIDQFLTGMIAGAWMRQVRRPVGSREAWTVFSAGLAAIVVAAFLFRSAGGLARYPVGSWSVAQSFWIVIPAVEAACYALMIIGYLNLPRAKLALSGVKMISALMSHIGKISYSIYLNQWFVLVAFLSFGLVGTTFYSRLAHCIFFYIPALVALSTITYFLIEKPFMDFGRKRKPAQVQRPSQIAA